eukprot:PhM_4_TR16078/c0_g1_i2/m.94344
MSTARDSVERDLRAALESQRLRQVFDMSVEALLATYPDFRTNAYDVMSKEGKESFRKLWNLASQHNNESWETLREDFLHYDGAGYFHRVSPQTDIRLMSFANILDMSHPLHQWYFTQNTYVQQQVRTLWICGKVDSRISHFVEEMKKKGMMTVNPLDMFGDSSSSSSCSDGETQQHAANPLHNLFDGDDNNNNSDDGDDWASLVSGANNGSNVVTVNPLNSLPVPTPVSTTTTTRGTPRVTLIMDGDDNASSAPPATEVATPRAALTQSKFGPVTSDEPDNKSDEELSTIEVLPYTGPDVEIEARLTELCTRYYGHETDSIRIDDLRPMLSLIGIVKSDLDLVRSVAKYTDPMPFSNFYEYITGLPEWPTCTLNLPVQYPCEPPRPAAREVPWLQRAGMKIITKRGEFDEGSETANRLPPATANELSKSLMRISRWCIFRACLAGAISAVISGLLELLIEKIYPDANTTPWESDSKADETQTIEYWVLLMTSTLLISMLEIFLLYFDALTTSLKLGQQAGFPMHSTGAMTVQLRAAYARNALELGRPTESFHGINPLRRKKKFMATLQLVLFKAKTTIMVFIVRVVFKRALSRAAAKSASPFAAAPILIMMNGLMQYFVMEEAVCITTAMRSVGYLSRQLLCGHIVPHYVREHILQMGGCITVLREDMHPSIEALLVDLDHIFGGIFDMQIHTGTTFDEWTTAVFFLRRIDDGLHRRLIIYFAIVFAVISGNTLPYVKLLRVAMIALKFKPGVSRIRTMRHRLTRGHVIRVEDLEELFEDGGVDRDGTRPLLQRFMSINYRILRAIFAA